MKYNSNRLVLLTFAIMQMALASAQKTLFSYNNPQPLHEVRAVWLTTKQSLDWPKTKATDARSIQRQKQELRNILDDLHYVHINTVILQTRIRGSVIYPSKYEPWDACLTGTPGKDPGYDPLQFCIDECHARGMECHAWVVSIPLDKQNVQNSYGDASVASKHPELCRTAGEEMFMLPGNPATADYIANICREITEKYDVDGISLDYIRYPESLYKFSDDDLKGETTKSTSAWRRDNITRIVRAVHNKVKAVKPWVKLSSSPIGRYRNLKSNPTPGWNCMDGGFQNPVAWLKEGIQDMVFPMMYWKGENFYRSMYDWAENSSKRPVCPGLGIYFLDPRESNNNPWDINDVRAEMFAARNREMGGVALYRSDFLTRDCGGLFNCCYEELFMYPSLTTRMTWEGDTIAPSKPQNMHFTASRLSWDASTDYCPSSVVIPTSSHNYVTYNIYGSDKFPVDTRKAENLLCSRVMSRAFNIENISATKKYFAVTAVDRFGNESEPALGTYDGNDVCRNLDVRSLIFNTYQTAIPVIPEIDLASSDPSKYDSETDFDLSKLDMSNAIITKRGAPEKFRPRERLVLVSRNSRNIIDEDGPKKKLSITARNNLRKKAKREAKEREKQMQEGQQ